MPLSPARNTLLSASFITRLMKLPGAEEPSAAIREIVTQFAPMRTFAGEIHTELQLVKPMLKTLGYAFESKPKFFEEHVKGAEFALFESDDERARSAQLWGTRAYYEEVLSLVHVKRYGRNLGEGISGFYLDFENRIPLYQSLYLSKKAAIPWSIVTNGKNWMLMKKPAVFEKRMIEIDLEEAVLSNDREMLALFYHLFSASGLKTTLPRLMEEERTELIRFLKERKGRFSRALEGAKPTEVPRVVAPIYDELFRTANPAKPYDQSDILTYLLTRGTGATPSFEEPLLALVRADRTKERLLSLKILDMTPGFGAVAVQLVETLAYLSFLLPYREKHTFVAEWENEQLLNRHIATRVIHGVEKHPFPLDVLQRAMLSRFNTSAASYRLGNPLLGMSLSEIEGLSDGKKEPDLFSSRPMDAIAELKEMYRLYFSLSDRIKEDAAVKNELAEKLEMHTGRFRTVMDLTTAAYFDRNLENKKIQELLYYMDGDEATWEAVRNNDSFAAAREISQRKHFFHMELEFPFLLNDRFDCIVIQPALHYLWEHKSPVQEMTKAFIKRAMTYLKQTGLIVLVGIDAEETVSELKRSRKYAVELQEGAVTVRRR